MNSILPTFVFLAGITICLGASTDATTSKVTGPVTKQVTPPNSLPLLPSIGDLLSPFQQLLSPTNKRSSNPLLPPQNAALLPNFLSPDIFRQPSPLTYILNMIMQLPPEMNIQEQIILLQNLLQDNRLPQYYVSYARALLSLLQNQPILRELQRSIGEIIQRPFNFNLSTSGQGLNNLQFSTSFDTPSASFLPSLQSSFNVATNPGMNADTNWTDNQEDDEDYLD